MGFFDWLMGIGPAAEDRYRPDGVAYGAEWVGREWRAVRPPNPRARARAHRHDTAWRAGRRTAE